ncbi:MAG: class I SAM-dependent methyltransferase [bacterium]
MTKGYRGDTHRDSGIRATDGQWNSSTTLYIARRLHDLAQGRRLSVLDMGCGDGTVIEHLLDYGYDLYGYDLAGVSGSLRDRVAAYADASGNDRIRTAPDDRSIPFEDDSFDVIYANQVFEHVRFIDRMFGECARVLRPDGVLLATFPLATSPVEAHIGIPWAHWIPPGRCRIRYLSLFYALRLRPRLAHCTAEQTAHRQDRYLSECTYYRFMNEIVSLADYYFDSCRNETDLLIRAKADLLNADRTTARRWLGAMVRSLEGSPLTFLVTHLIDAAFCMTNPHK